MGNLLDLEVHEQEERDKRDTLLRGGAALPLLLTKPAPLPSMHAMRGEISLPLFAEPFECTEADPEYGLRPRCVVVRCVCAVLECLCKVWCFIYTLHAHTHLQPHGQ